MWIVANALPERVLNSVQTAFYDMTAERGFIVKNLLVEGRHYTEADVLRGLVNVERGDAIFSFSPKDVQDSIERLSWVKSARVERRLPDTIYVGLIERKPLALWQNKGKLRLIDDEGVTLTDQDLEAYGKLMIVVGEEAPAHAKELLDMLAVEPLILAQVEAATWVSERRWDLKLVSGIIVKLPESDMGLALRSLAAAQEEERLLDKDLTVIDLREPDRMSVRARPGAATEVKAGKKDGNNI